MQLKMTKKKIIKEDGRYLIFYEFEEAGQKGEAAPPENSEESES